MLSALWRLIMFLVKLALWLTVIAVFGVTLFVVLFLLWIWLAGTSSPER